MLGAPIHEKAPPGRGLLHQMPFAQTLALKAWPGRNLTVREGLMSIF
jgi:hypothetical protein